MFFLPPSLVRFLICTLLNIYRSRLVLPTGKIIHTAGKVR